MDLNNKHWQPFCFNSKKFRNSCKYNDICDTQARVCSCMLR